MLMESTPSTILVCCYVFALIKIFFIHGCPFVAWYQLRLEYSSENKLLLFDDVWRHRGIFVCMHQSHLCQSYKASSVFKHKNILEVFFNDISKAVCRCLIKDPAPRKETKTTKTVITTVLARSHIKFLSLHTFSIQM